MAAFRQTVIIAEDDPVTRDRLELLLKRAGYQTVVYNGQSTFANSGYLDGVPSIMIVGDQYGAEFLRFLSSISCMIPVIFIHSGNSVQEAVNIIRAGAADYLTKPFYGESVIEAVRRAMVTAQQMAHVRARQKDLREKAATLSDREREIVKLMVDGLLNKQIAGALGIALITVKVHRSRAMRKLGARTAAELARLAQDSGLLSVGKNVTPDPRDNILALTPAQMNSPIPTPPLS